MEKIGFKFRGTSGIKDSVILGEGKRLASEIRRVREALREGYDTEYASINLPSDSGLLKTVRKVVLEKKRLKPRMLVVVGIGGSNLGTMAVHEAVNGRFYDEGGDRVYFADTVDEDKLKDILATAEETLKRGQNILVNVVTKSGKTTETIAVFELFVRLLKKYKKKQYSKYVVATTDRDSRLWDFALKEDYTLLEIPKNVGGRYSVFSAVGLFPLAMLGVNIRKLQSGAASIIPACIRGDVLKNPAALSAVITYIHGKRGRNISDLFLFSTDLESVGKWYRQLLGESIGKEWNRKQSRRVHAGITPTVSIGSTDLHSMAQLYLGGPKDKLTTFVRVKKNNTVVTLPKINKFNQLVGGIQGKPVQKIMDAIMEGTKIAFQQAGRPFMEVVLPDKSEASIAQFLQFKMIEVMYLGCLLDVNPFDQPAVELYKKETRRILARK
jgi:glucose-6-phosphate isomerase